ncbi:methyltransferase domain-containing protein [Pseudidiomarina terrestris]|uniref:tRNA 5-carboxymethoxyuridine methyltransferase n=1 Tax=Pseudidiomarina terrestris TaxID=2820060 RepID=A0AAW7QVC3_9GAMM|nr:MULTISPECIES: methyltransferase domain-containing protein [unclassified Pseudidiomarina]MDN7124205.1 methyltransferase domain-containing protein [Pseudidiomarina sp. 1APP75-32.1]MDN7127272.1 methyltransferase domain-containing protein [Pseudidiomarina sp. 1APR75-33.1]MDN7135290.1 methyltransferase domain-containing protein [Pseudidiomarina sp. 1ASP75-5]MDN7138651.1 methyltransferase domain-containing protein [Pseudidiomarina sp. 1ASP75-14]
MRNDQSFAGLTDKFAKNIYATAKGKIRLAVLERDLEPLYTGARPLSVLDVGAGIGQFSQNFARHGHNVVHTDIADEMVAAAREQHQAAGLSSYYSYFTAPLQELPDRIGRQQFDVVLCHAVLEWLADPASALQVLQQFLKADGALSLMFYNRNAKLMANMVFGNFDYVEADLQVKKRVRMSPQQPIAPQQLEDWLAQHKLTVMQRTGVRCFHDYLREPLNAERFEQLLRLELKYSQTEPFSELGRYQHWQIRHAAQ